MSRITPDAETIRLHEDVAAAVHDAIELPCPFWVHVHVERTAQRPAADSPSMPAAFARRARAWLGAAESRPERGDLPSLEWITGERFRVVLTARRRRPDLHGYPAVANPTSEIALYAPPASRPPA